MPEPTEDEIEEVRAVIAELDEIGPTIHALIVRAARAYSAIELTRIGGHDSADEEEVFNERTGRNRLYELVFRLHEVTDDHAMMTDELAAARDLEAWQGRIACHGTTDACIEAETCGRFQ